MDSDFLEFYENICYHLKNTYQNNNTWEIQTSEKTLISLSEQYGKFLEILSVIITNEKNEGYS